MSKCPYCQTEISAVYFSTTCPSCQKELHTCLTCAFYSPSSHYECKESIQDPVRDKNRKNFCDFFRLTTQQVQNKTKSAEEAKALFDSLFSI